MTRLLLFATGSVLLIAVSRKSLLRPRSHGFYRFFAWEAILALILLNAPAWFRDPLALRQLISWVLLTVSFLPLLYGVQSLRRQGRPGGTRAGDRSLLAFETTTSLVTTDIYALIRHPLYASLLLLAWGVFFKVLSWMSGLLVAAATLFLVATARADEAECIRFFGEEYRTYMRKTKMFIPYIL
ncbi:MAG: methyltransferase family protein [Bacteroidota bacterium]